MAAALFPDNTVLCNFAAVDRLDLLRDWLRGRGRWTEAVAYEAEQSAQVLPPLAQVVHDGWLGEPVTLTDKAAMLRIEHLRCDVFGGERSQPLKHLGEAQTCYLLKEVSQWQGSWWVTDDREALHFARRQGITSRETLDLVAAMVADAEITAQAAYDLLHSMVSANRSLRLPKSLDDLLR